MRDHRINDGGGEKWADFSAFNVVDGFDQFDFQKTDSDNPFVPDSVAVANRESVGISSQRNRHGRRREDEGLGNSRRRPRDSVGSRGIAPSSSPDGGTRGGMGDSGRCVKSYARSPQWVGKIAFN